MKFKAKPLLRWSNEKWMGFYFDWDEQGKAITESLKNFPVRAWDPANRTWWFPESHANLLVSTVRGFFPEVKVPAKPTVVADVRSPQRDDHRILGLHPEASNGVVKAAYKALAKELDPDLTVGGISSNPFDEVQGAYERVCRARGLEP